MGRLWVRAATAVLVAAALVAMSVLLLRPWRLVDPDTRSAVLTRLSAASGLSVGEAGAMTLRLAPLPAVEIEGVAMAGLGGAVTIQAERLSGRLRLAELLRGRLTLGAATLLRPTIVADLDRLLPLATAVIAAPARGLSRFRWLQTDGVTLRSGVLRLLSGDPRRDTLVTGLSVTWAWPGDGATASIAGSGVWRGIRTSLDAELGAPSGTGVALASARLQSPVLDVGFNGTLTQDPALTASGRLSAATPALPAFLRAIDTPAPQLAAFTAASVSGQATVTADGLSLSDARLGLDSMAFEGALAVHPQAGRPALAGTLATDAMDLDPFLRALPDAFAPGGHWNEADLALRRVADDDIDLRISASHAQVRGLRFEDGSLSLQSGKGRMELSLGEAHAYDGLLKGRVLATAEHEAAGIRADFNLSRVDLSKLVRDLGWPKTLAGTVTGRFSLAGEGSSPAAIVGSLTGHAQIGIRDGAVGSRLAAAVVEPGPPDDMATPVPAAPRRFESASADLDIVGGVAQLTEGWVLWPDARAVVVGAASIPLLQVEMRARLSAIGDDADSPSSPPAGYTLTGPWRRPTLSPLDDRATANGR